MKMRMAKKLLGMLLPLAALLIHLGIATACAETGAMIDFDEIIANYEPRPGGLPSFQASAPFDPIVPDPHELAAEVEKCECSDEIMALSCDLGLPISAGDCDDVYRCRNDRACTRYPLPKGQWKLSESVTLTCAFADFEGSSDDLAFVLAGNAATCSLIDILPSMDELKVVTDADHETPWLVGETRSGEGKSIR